jgi:hypothetical protein
MATSRRLDGQGQRLCEVPLYSPAMVLTATTARCTAPSFTFPMYEQNLRHVLDIEQVGAPKPLHALQADAALLLRVQAANITATEYSVNQNVTAHPLSRNVRGDRTLLGRGWARWSRWALPTTATIAVASLSLSAHLL